MRLLKKGPHFFIDMMKRKGKIALALALSTGMMGMAVVPQVQTPVYAEEATGSTKEEIIAQITEELVRAQNKLAEETETLKGLNLELANLMADIAEELEKLGLSDMQEATDEKITEWTTKLAELNTEAEAYYSENQETIDNYSKYLELKEELDRVTEDLAALQTLCTEWDVKNVLNEEKPENPFNDNDSDVDLETTTISANMYMLMNSIANTEGITEDQAEDIETAYKMMKFAVDYNYNLDNMITVLNEMAESETYQNHKISFTAIANTLTGKVDMNPVDMADYAANNGGNADVLYDLGTWGTDVYETKGIYTVEEMTNLVQDFLDAYEPTANYTDDRQVNEYLTNLYLYNAKQEYVNKLVSERDELEAKKTELEEEIDNLNLAPDAEDIYNTYQKMLKEIEDGDTYLDNYNQISTLLKQGMETIGADITDYTVDDADYLNNFKTFRQSVKDSYTQNFAEKFVDLVTRRNEQVEVVEGLVETVSQIQAILEEAENAEYPEEGEIVVEIPEVTDTENTTEEDTKDTTEEKVTEIVDADGTVTTTGMGTGLKSGNVLLYLLGGVLGIGVIGAVVGVIVNKKNKKKKK